MQIIHSIILGVIEGLTEFLPVSSTAHLIISGELLKLESTEFLKSFEIIIQFGAILSVLVIYWRRFLSCEVIKRLILAFIPTAILGFLFYDLVKGVLLENLSTIAWSLLLGGLVLIIFENLFKKPAGEAKIESISYFKCLLIGLFQSIAMVPGVSRSAATILGGLALGLNRKTIVEFSFLLAVPTMLAASVFDLYKSFEHFDTQNSLVLAVGFIVSFVTAWLGIKFFLNYIKRYNFIPFGVYRVILGALLLLFWL